MSKQEKVPQEAGSPQKTDDTYVAGGILAEEKKARTKPQAWRLPTDGATVHTVHKPVLVPGQDPTTFVSVRIPLQP
jgi:hypothetical protein